MGHTCFNLKESKVQYEVVADNRVVLVQLDISVVLVLPAQMNPCISPLTISDLCCLGTFCIVLSYVCIVYVSLLL